MEGQVTRYLVTLGRGRTIKIKPQFSHPQITIYTYLLFIL